MCAKIFLQNSYYKMKLIYIINVGLAILSYWHEIGIRIRIRLVLELEYMYTSIQIQL